MRINTEKTKTMVIGRSDTKHKIRIKDLQQLSRFKYLGTVITQDGKFDEEVQDRASSAGRLFNGIKTLSLKRRKYHSLQKWRSTNI